MEGKVIAVLDGDRVWDGPPGLPPEVVIIFGSRSDLESEIVRSSKMFEILDNLKVTYDVVIGSAHRNSEEIREKSRSVLADQHVKVVIGIGGKSLALPGVLAAGTFGCKPIIGVGLASKEHANAQEAVDSMLYMPRGVPVLVAGVNKDGCINAALAAAQIVFAGSHELQQRLLSYWNKSVSEKPFEDHVQIDTEEV